MSTAVATVPGRAAPRRPVLERRTAMRLAGHEYELFVAQLRELGNGDWTKPTACSAWDVHAMACHVLGMARLAASPLEQFRQTRAARKRGGLFIDALTALQVEEHVHRSNDEIIEMLAVATRRAAKGRARIPSFIRNRSMGEQPVDEKGIHTEEWTVGYLSDVVLTRDTWIHRSDVALATGRAMTLAEGHDGRIVADVAAEWTQRHGEACTLTLTGPAGGMWTSGEAGPSYYLDAERFCRIVSGRAPGEGLLRTRVPF